MVEVGDRPATAREAEAEGFISMEPATLAPTTQLAGSTE